MKPDILTRIHIEHLVSAVYYKVKRDSLISFFFNDVAKVNWEKHLPLLYDFWEQIIFQSNTYSDKLMQTHLVLHHNSPMTAEHFERLLKLFNETVDEMYQGPNSDFTKQRAQSIADTMQAKIFSTTF